MENQEKLMQFVTWLGENVPELKGKAPEQIVETVNKLSTSEQGQQMLQGLIKEFESSMTGMFKKGGKLGYLLCLKKGGSIQDCGCGKKIDKKQPGGSIASRLWNKWTGKDTYTDGYGTTRSHTPVRESAHRTIVKAANSPLVQAIPVVGDIADGYVAADYAAKGDYKPAIAAIGAGLVLPNAMEVAGRMVPSSAYRNIADKADDFVEILGVEPPNKKWNRTPDKKFNNIEDNSSVWIPETQYDDDLNVIAGSLDDSMSSEPWWGWDPVEYQKGGRVLGSEQYPHASRKDAIDAAKQLGFKGSDARRAYGDSKKMTRQLGFRGNNLRQVARYNLIDMAYPRAGMTKEESMDNLLNNFTTKISYN